MVAVEWANLGYAGAFVVGAIAGAVVTIRLAKVLAAFLAGLRDRDDQ